MHNFFLGQFFPRTLLASWVDGPVCMASECHAPVSEALQHRRIGPSHCHVQSAASPAVCSSQDRCLISGSLHLATQVFRNMREFLPQSIARVNRAAPRKTAPPDEMISGEEVATGRAEIAAAESRLAGGDALSAASPPALVCRPASRPPAAFSCADCAPAVRPACTPPRPFCRGGLYLGRICVRPSGAPTQ